MKTILFPTDFSDNSVHASKYAGMLARRLNAKVVLLHTFSIPMVTEYQVPYDVDGVVAFSKEAAEENLRTFTAKFIENTRLTPDRVSQKTEYGLVSDVITMVSREINADMIVMGTKGASNVLDKWFGTNAQSVMNSAECPVWIIPNKAPIDYPQHIMYAADFEEDEILATQKILTIIEPLGATCKAVHINDYYELNVGHKVESMTKDLNDDFENEDVTFTNLNRTDIVAGLETYIRTHQPDVLALAIHEKSFLGKIFYTSISKHFVQEAKLPLLTFRK